MNIVFYLSEAADFTPFYNKKLPIEIFPWANGSLFGEIYTILEREFSRDEIFVIDSCNPAVFYELFDEAGVLNFPTQSLFAKMFLFSSFSIAYQLHPFTLFVPANLVIRDTDRLFSTIRKIQRNDLSANALTFFAKNDAASGYAIEAGDKMFDREINLYSVGKFLPQFSVRKALEENPESLFYYSADLFSLDTMKWGESLREVDENLGELYFLLVNAWKDKTSMKTVMQDVIVALEKYSLDFIVAKTVDKLVCPVGDIYQKLNGFADFLEFLPTDENGNYIEGNVTLLDVSGSVIINRSPMNLSLHHLRNVTCFADKKTIHTGRF